MLIALSQSRLSHGAVVELILHILELFFPIILASNLDSTLHSTTQLIGFLEILLSSFISIASSFSVAPYLLSIFFSCYRRTACLTIPGLELTTCSGSCLVPLGVEISNLAHWLLFLGTSAEKLWLINKVQTLFSDSYFLTLFSESDLNFHCTR